MLLPYRDPPPPPDDDPDVRRFRHDLRMADVATGARLVRARLMFGGGLLVGLFTLAWALSEGGRQWGYALHGAGLMFLAAVIYRAQRPPR